MSLRVLPASARRRMRWKNGGGWTTEIARDPAGAEAFRWRVSLAEIESDGPFSAFPGVDRDLLLVDGAGIELAVGDAPPRRLERRFERLRFAGEADVRCRLIDGPTRDFNVMVRRGELRAETFARPLVGPMVMFPQAGEEWLIHVLSGHAEARAREGALDLEAGASLLIDLRPPAEPRRLSLDGAGELVFARFAAPA